MPFAFGVKSFFILEKAEESRDQIANIHWIIEKAREFQKNIYFCFIDYAKAFDCVDHNKLWKIPEEMGIPDHLTCLLRKLHAGQEATVRFQIGKGVRQGCILSSCLFNLYAEYLMRNAGLEETQAGIKIAKRNTNNLRYADDTSSLSAIRVVSSAYLRLLIFLLAILIPACVSSSPAFLMMYSEYKLNKQGDNIQP